MDQNKNEALSMLKFIGLKWLVRLSIFGAIFLLFFSPDTAILLFSRLLSVLLGLTVLKFLKRWVRWLVKPQPKQIKISKNRMTEKVKEFIKAPKNVQG